MKKLPVFKHLVDEFEIALDEKIQAQIEEAIKCGADAEKPLDVGEGAAYLHITKSHLYQLTSKGLIAHYKPAGKKIYFRRRDLDAYLLRNRRAAEGSEGRSR